MTTDADAREIAQLFPRIYEHLHAVRPRGYRPTMQSLAVLLHLNRSGPLTIAELSRHLGRSQSVVSEIVTRMERRKVLARVRDERDRRRTLVWLTPQGQTLLRDETSVLSIPRLEQALASRSPREREVILQGLRLLVAAAEGAGPGPRKPRRRRKE